MSVTLAPDAWMAGVFGHAVFRVSWPAGDEDTAAGQQALREAFAAVPGPAFYYVKVPTDRVDRVRALCALGFDVVDVNTTFDRAPERLPDPAPSPVVIRGARPEDHAGVLGIAATTFVTSRFHLDRRVPHGVADEIKRAWVENYCLGQRGEGLLVAAVEGRPAGFLAVLDATVNGKAYRVIDLVGVARSYQGKGVGRRLVEAFISCSAGRCDMLRVGTQVANIPSMRLYESCGFLMTETSYVLHAHRNGGGTS